GRRLAGGAARPPAGGGVGGRSVLAAEARPRPLPVAGVAERVALTAPAGADGDDGPVRADGCAVGEDEVDRTLHEHRLDHAGPRLRPSLGHGPPPAPRTAARAGPARRPP